ncbi:hypothetical protein M1293_01705 [Candidatus Parvarchaeota archaeon]|nr:hypothetical protein [Candidatus Parvarchaeota archaeon]
MKKAGIAVVGDRIILAIIIDNGLQIYRIKTLQEAKEILNTAKPDVMGVEKSAAGMYEDLSFSYTTEKVDSSAPADREKVIAGLTMLNIIRNEDWPAIYAACYV